MMILKCANCFKSINKTKSELKKSKSGNVYCSSSCAAKTNNKTPKRKLKNKCNLCHKFIVSNVTYCPQCYKAKHELSNKTLSEAIKNRKDANRYTGIRGNARKIYMKSNKPKCCIVCGYDKHIEICHVKGISEFSLDTLISVINDPDNLEAMCRNHHWESEHDC